MSLRGRRILITSGPTRAPIDAVRFISNKSTGRLGSLIAEAALEAGADVTFVYGRGSALPLVRGGRIDHLRVLPIDTVDELVAVFRQELPSGYDAVVHAMAVLDFQPAETSEEKTSSTLREWNVRLVPTPKAAALVRDLAPKTFFIGFKLEVDRSPAELVDIAADWARRTHADLVVANDMRDIEQGTHTGHLVRPDGSVDQVVQGKEMIARALVTLLGRRLGDSSATARGGSGYAAAPVRHETGPVRSRAGAEGDVRPSQDSDI
jgi:phosphopantothenoylcysteine synthetase/decarboxylase